MGEPKLRLQGVSQVYEGARGETRALQNMDIDVAPGEAVAILGPSGCGKSTSLLIAAGLNTALILQFRPSSLENRCGKCGTRLADS